MESTQAPIPPCSPSLFALFFLRTLKKYHQTIFKNSSDDNSLSWESFSLHLSHSLINEKASDFLLQAGLLSGCLHQMLLKEFHRLDLASDSTMKNSDSVVTIDSQQYFINLLHETTQPADQESISVDDADASISLAKGRLPPASAHPLPVPINILQSLILKIKHQQCTLLKDTLSRQGNLKEAVRSIVSWLEERKAPQDDPHPKHSSDEETKLDDKRPREDEDPSTASYGKVESPASSVKETKKPRLAPKRTVDNACQKNASTKESASPSPESPTMAPAFSGRSSHSSVEGDVPMPKSSPPLSSSSLSFEYPKEWKKQMYSILKELAFYKNASIFSRPVRDEDAPMYSKVIKESTCINIIKTKIRDNDLQRTEEVHRELLLMFINALMYNGPGSDVYEITREMMPVADKLIEDLYENDRKAVNSPPKTQEAQPQDPQPLSSPSRKRSLRTHP